MENKNTDLRVINFNAYVPTKITEEIIRGKDWIKYGEDNNYYQYVIDTKNQSTTNSTIINSITNYIYGKGLSARDAAQKPNDYAIFLSLFKKKDVRRIVSDIKLFGNAAYQVIYNSDHTKIVEVAHLPVQTLRAEIADSESGEIEGYWYSKDWTNTRKFKPIRYPAFGTSTEALEIVFIKPYVAGSFYYGQPDYQGGLVWAEIEYEIATYHISNIQGGFSPTTLINFNNGQAESEEAKSEIEKSVNKKFSGSGKSKILLSFNDGVEAATTIETIQLSDAADQYQFLSEESEKKIIISHKVTSRLLMGLDSSNGFASNSDEIKNAAIFMDNTVIGPFRELLIESFDETLAFNEITLDLFFKTLTPWVSEDQDDIDETNDEEVTDDNIEENNTED